MKERVRLVLEWERRWLKNEGDVNVAELCREFGVTRACGSKWIRRYRAASRDVRSVEERSRRPHRSPTAIDEKVQSLVVQARKARPKWGPRKLKALLVERFPGMPIPSASSIASILKRHGLARPTGRRRRAAPDPRVSAPFAECDAPNRVWCVDFKGWFLMKNGRKCYPLTITDAFSRYVIRCESMEDPDGPGVFEIFDSAFRELGVPDAIRSDGGPPFASTGAAGLTRLSVWWLQLGIRVERIAPGKPQQNGRHERMHRTLAEDVEPQANLQRQQRAFDLWRREFNEERPHEALRMRPPARVYHASSKSYPRPLMHPEHHSWDRVEQIDKDGFIRFGKRRVFISSALRYLYIELERMSETKWDVRWGAILLGRIYSDSLERGIAPTRRRRGQITVLCLRASKDEKAIVSAA